MVVLNKTRKKRVPLNPEIPLPSSVKPGDNFYMHINGNWLRHARMPPYLSSYGVSEEIESIIDDELLEILYESRAIVRSNPDKIIPHTKYLLGTLTESVVNSSSQKINIKFLKSMVGSFKCIRDTFDVATTLGDFIKHRIPTSLILFVDSLDIDSEKLYLILGPGSLGLPDLSYYRPTLTKSRIITAYGNLLHKLGIEFDVDGLEQVFGIEEIIADSIFKSKNDDEYVIKIKNLKTTYKNIPWDALFESSLGWNSSETDKHEIIVMSKSYLNALNKWFVSFPINTWKLLFSCQLILYMLPLLPPPFDDWDYELFGKRMRGQSEKTPQHRVALHLAKQWLGASLGSTFVNLHVSALIKRQVTSIAKEIQRSAVSIAGNTEWLEESTRKIAANKVSNIYLGIAYPTNLHKDKKTTQFTEKLINNILTLGELDFQDEMKKMDTILKPEDWDDNVFAVNAYYYNQGNRLILPAGILRWPFFNINASDGWNFGGLGATIGHEISHAFDNDGKDYDENGNKNPWWSKSEQDKYHKKTKAIINLYNKTIYFGNHLNGVLTLSENIADLGGVHIALAALKNRLKKNNATPLIVKKEICDFFTSFAVSWRTKEKKEKAFQSLFMDVHAPPPPRVNNIVSQFDEWYECFDIKPGEPLYKDPTQRIRIF
jgi:putative endopeptidase